MNTLQKNELVLNRKVQVILNSIMATSANPALVPMSAALKTGLDRIVELSDVQDAPLQGKRDARDEAVDRASDTALVIARLLVGYARKHGRTELASQIRATREGLSQLRPPQRLRVAERLLAAAREVIGELASYGLTAGMLDDFAEQIAAATAAVDRLTVAAVDRKVATAQLLEAFQGCRDLRRNEINPAVDLLRDTHPEFCARYDEASRTVHRPGTRGEVESESETSAAAGAVTTPATASAVATGAEKAAA